MRCFVALDLPAPVRNHLANTTAPLRGRYQVGWVASDQLHLTLVFAGDLPDENVDALVDAVRDVELPSMQLALQQFGWFPPRGGLPRVLWVGLDGDLDVLTTLQRNLAEAAEPLGVAREKRGFTPHITLGRVRSPFGALALLDELRAAGKALNTKPFTPMALVLYRSTLTPSGPLHEPLLHRRLTLGLTPGPD